jgi:cold shock CspA family protein
MQGIVARYNAERRYGFSRPDGARSSDVFFHVSAWPAGNTPTVDTPVEFTIETDPRSGRLRASSVRPL